MALYALYGASMDPKLMLERCPQSPLAGTGWLEGWRLTFGGEEYGWDGALATIVQEPGERVFVTLYDISRFDQDTLDAWEGADSYLYRSIRARVHTLDRDLLASLYVLDAYEGGFPSRRYLTLIADAAESAGAPDDYVALLRGRPCGGADS